MKTKKRNGEKFFVIGFILSILFFELTLAVSVYAADSTYAAYTSGSSSSTSLSSSSSSLYSSSTYSSTNTQYTEPSIDSYYSGIGVNYLDFWPILSNSDTCTSGDDFMVQIRPGGCSPAVVRSDLLEEQNVPVFCKLDAIKLNPLIDISAINSVTFSGTMPEGVAGVSYYPAKAALRTSNTYLDNEYINDVGYVVISLKKQPSESKMPEFISGNLTAVMKYDILHAYGSGKPQLILDALTDAEWNDQYKSYGFWNGKAFLRLDYAESDKAEILVYSDKDKVYSKVSLKVGETSNLIYMPGFYCKAGIRIALDSFNVPERKVRLKVDENEYWLREGESFLDSQCRVISIGSIANGGNVQLRCFGKTLSLKIGMSDTIKFESNNKLVEGKVGEILKEESGYKYYLVYSGLAPESLGLSDRRFVVIARNLSGGFINSEGNVNPSDLELLASSLKTTSTYTSKSEFQKFVAEKVKSKFKINDGDITVSGIGESSAAGLKVSDTGASYDKEYSGISGNRLAQYFQAAKETAKELVAFYKNQLVNNEDLGQKSLIESANLAGYIGKRSTQKEIMNEYNIEFKDGQYLDMADSAFQDFAQYNYDNSGGYIDFGSSGHYFNLIDIKEPGYDDASVTFAVSSFGDKKVKKGEEIVRASEIGTTESYSIINRGQIKEEGSRLIVQLSEGNFSLMNGYLEWFNVSSWIAASNYKGQTDSWKNQLQTELTSYRNKHSTLSSSSSGEERAVLTDFDANSARITFFYRDQSGYFRTEEKTITTGEFASVGIFGLRIQNINLKKEATVRIISEVPNEYAKDNFSFNIGIEKRAIQLSPEKASEQIESLNKTIEKWQKIVDQLGKVVKGWKTACFATAALITVKNFFENLGGESMARQQVMQGKGGWTEKCTKLVSEGKYSTLNACYLGEKDKINGAVDSLTSEIAKTNEEISKIDSKYTSGDFLGGDSVDSKAAGQEYMNTVFIPYCQQNKDKTVTLSDGSKMTLGDICGDSATVAKMYNSSQLSMEDMRNIVTYGRASDNSAATEIANSKLAGVMEPLKAKKVQSDGETKLSGILGNQVTSFAPTSGKKTSSKADIKKLTNTQASQLGGQNLSGGDEIVMVTIPYTTIDTKTKVDYSKISEKNVIIKVKEQSKDIYKIESGYYLESSGKATLMNSDELKQLKDYLSRECGISYFEKSIAETCSNAYKSYKVKYFETGTNKGLPAVVPVDIKKGWYAGMKSDVSSGLFSATSTAQSAYKESAQINSFWLCNVGQNGLEEFDSAVGDDSPCIQINLNTGQSTDQISCLTKDEATKLVSKAKSLITEASKQYGKKSISLSGIGTVEVGNPATSTSGSQCQDFMSPEDCNIMFNACDPVICPSSRCNLGGAYPVSDVIQTGVVGSALLCLPNIREGIVVPVCLSGIQAGLDSYLSVMKSYRDCLQANLDNGTTVGICDEIYSVYLCEFFWKQAAPIMELAIPKIVEGFYGQGTRGGGEYLTVQNAWSNLESSTTYFTDYYAANALKAFKARSVNEAGTTVCQMFIGTKYPTTVSLFDELTEADSPVQFYAYFDASTYSEATVPTTDQYKVYYHIYGGKDSGHYYSVYLKDPPASSYYSTYSTVNIDTGYISIGQSVDKTKDFTAPTGYKQLCVRIDNQEYCGFKQVSTDFAVNYIKDTYVASQATSNVSSEAECVSGSPSLLTSSLNVQSTASSIVSPSVYNYGLIRVCSSENPGLSTTPARWSQTGWCDKAKGIGCWLDADSVVASIQNLEIRNQTLSQAENLSQTLGGSGMWTAEESISQLSQAKEAYKTLTVSSYDDLNSNEFIASDAGQLISKLNQIQVRSSDNSYKIEAGYIKFEIYKKLTTEYYNKNFAMTSATPSTTSIDTVINTQGKSELVYNLDKASASVNLMAGDKVSFRVSDVDYQATLNQIINSQQVELEFKNIAIKTVNLDETNSLDLNSDGIFEINYAISRIANTNNFTLTLKKIETTSTTVEATCEVEKPALTIDGNILTASATGSNGCVGKTVSFSLLRSESWSLSNILGQDSLISKKDVVFSRELGGVFAKDTFELGTSIGGTYYITASGDVSIKDSTSNKMWFDTLEVQYNSLGCDIAGQAVTNTEYISRYSDYKSLFKKYSADYPTGLDEKSFRALLVAISQKESRTGKDGVKKFTGYILEPSDANGQLLDTSDLLRRQINSPSGAYADCVSDNIATKVKCVLSHYGPETESGYAEEVYGFFLSWLGYICNEDKVSETTTTETTTPVTETETVPEETIEANCEVTNLNFESNVVGEVTEFTAEVYGGEDCIGKGQMTFNLVRDRLFLSDEDFGDVDAEFIKEGDKYLARALYGISTKSGTYVLTANCDYCYKNGAKGYSETSKMSI